MEGKGIWKHRVIDALNADDMEAIGRFIRREFRPDLQKCLEEEFGSDRCEQYEAEKEKEMVEYDAHLKAHPRKARQTHNEPFLKHCYSGRGYDLGLPQW